MAKCENNRSPSSTYNVQQPDYTSSKPSPLNQWFAGHILPTIHRYIARRVTTNMRKVL